MSIYTSTPNLSGQGLEIAPTLENQINGFMRYAGTQVGPEAYTSWGPILWVLSGGGLSASIPTGGAQLIQGVALASGASEATVQSWLTRNIGPAVSQLNGIGDGYGLTVNPQSGLTYVFGGNSLTEEVQFTTPDNLPYE